MDWNQTRQQQVHAKRFMVKLRKEWRFKNLWNLLLAQPISYRKDIWMMTASVLISHQPQVKLTWTPLELMRYSMHSSVLRLLPSLLLYKARVIRFNLTKLIQINPPLWLQNLDRLLLKHQQLESKIGLDRLRNQEDREHRQALNNLKKDKALIKLQRKIFLKCLSIE